MMRVLPHPSQRQGMDTTYSEHIYDSFEDYRENFLVSEVENLMVAFDDSNDNGNDAKEDFASNSKQPSTSSYDALEVEYRDMASWYDSFWLDYMNASFAKPLQLVQDAIKSVTKKKRKEIVNRNEEGISVLDVGCGTGEFLRRLVLHQQKQEAFNSVPVQYYGLEPSKEMLEKAKRKFEDAIDDTTKPTWINNGAEDVSLPNHSVDVVCSTSAFHFFADRNKALQEMHRALKPTGHLIITDWCNDARYFWVRLYHWVFDKLRWKLRGYAMYPGPQLSRQLVNQVQEAGFEDVQVETYIVRFWYVFLWGMQTVTARKPTNNNR